MYKLTMLSPTWATNYYAQFVLCKFMDGIKIM